MEVCVTGDAKWGYKLPKCNFVEIRATQKRIKFQLKMNSSLTIEPKVPPGWSLDMSVHNPSGLRQLGLKSFSRGDTDQPGIYLIRLRHHIASTRRRGIGGRPILPR